MILFTNVMRKVWLVHYISPSDKLLRQLIGVGTGVETFAEFI